ncbi:hypothetical protein K505DRAFT_417014 [Melanomma pulvis-pyrius CBS 109.77]|uniref:Uncharacterized protein n=1 Tax=Melanomma pulvis-pyrius CBS 109.77 TaxID=1314802 RepID=A0A6A6XEP9_9PLEO|nr:hypothetical protein K505DRAFT_417014 [Melanomma pulvis-pyrius CBS 109.77]
MPSHLSRTSNCSSSVGPPPSSLYQPPSSQETTQATNSTPTSQAPAEPSSPPHHRQMHQARRIPPAASKQTHEAWNVGAQPQPQSNPPKRAPGPQPRGPVYVGIRGLAAPAGCAGTRSAGSWATTRTTGCTRRGARASAGSGGLRPGAAMARARAVSRRTDSRTRTDSVAMWWWARSRELGASAETRGAWAREGARGCRVRSRRAVGGAGRRCPERC